jgi:hypothetical protein
LRFDAGWLPLKGTCGQGVTTTEFDETVPTGSLTIVIADLEVHLNGPWKAGFWLPGARTPGK